jgi:signal transduction histidine kinase
VKTPESIHDGGVSEEAAGNSALPESGSTAYAAYPWLGIGAYDLGLELLGMRPLLAAIAGPRIELEIESLPCGGPTRLSKEDLIRVLLNLVRNASEAMPEGGKLRITAQYGDGLSFLDPGQVPDALPCSVVIAVQDNGPGIPESAREQIFSAGFTTRETDRSWPGVRHRGLGLTIVRDLIEAAGGRVRVSSSSHGARFELELPITYGMYEITNTSGLMADSEVKGCIECQ